MRLTFARQVAGRAALATWLLFGCGCSIDDRLVRAGRADGSAGTGGASQNTGGADGAIHGCTAASTLIAPSNGAIGNFTGDVSVVPFSADASPTAFSQAGGTLTIQENQATAPSPQYPGLLVVFPGDCIDASGFSGVEFTIEGTVSGCALQYGTSFTEDTASSSPGGSCPQAVCYPPHVDIEPTATPATLQLPWVGLTYTPGSPIPDPNDPAGITGFEWQFAIPAASDGGGATCVANVNISGLKFYH